MVHSLVIKGIEISGKRIASKVIEGIIVTTLVTAVTGGKKTKSK